MKSNIKAIRRHGIAKVKRKKQIRSRHFRPQYPAPAKIAFADKMRDAPTSLEVLLYARLDEHGCRYERQSIQRGYILDAYIPKLRLAFEADGPLHNPGYDAQRDRNLEKIGIRTIRFSTHELQERQPHVDEVISFQVREAKKKYG